MISRHLFHNLKTDRIMANYSLKQEDINLLKAQGMVGAKKEAETRFKGILQDEIKYGKNEITTRRYYRYHDEIPGLMR